MDIEYLKSLNIFRTTLSETRTKEYKEQFEGADVVYYLDDLEYSAKSYIILKNKPELTLEELVYILDGGTFNFGVFSEGNRITIYTD